MQLTPQLVFGIAALAAVVILGVFGVLGETTVGGLLVGLFGGFGLGASHAQAVNGGPHP